MYYIEAILDDGSFINNLNIEDDNASIETSYGEHLILNINTKVTARVFEKVEPKTLNDLIDMSKQKGIYVALFDSEVDAVFNEFPEQNFKSLLESEEIDIEDVYVLKYETPWGKLVGKEKELSLKEIYKISEISVDS